MNLEEDVLSTVEIAALMTQLDGREEPYTTKAVGRWMIQYLDTNGRLGLPSTLKGGVRVARRKDVVAFSKRPRQGGNPDWRRRGAAAMSPARNKRTPEQREAAAALRLKTLGLKPRTKEAAASDASPAPSD